MIKNLADYFLPEQEFYLKNVEYKKIEKVIPESEYVLNCIDNLEVNVNEKRGVQVIATRKLKFDPEELFSLTVTFGANLKFCEDKKAELKWTEINLAEEFRDNGQFVLGNLMSRISLLIAEITSSYGQPPLMLPPSIGK